MQKWGRENIFQTDNWEWQGRKIRSEIHKFIHSIWKKELLPEEWKESIIVPIYKKGDKTDCSYYRDEIIGNYQGGFRCNRSTTDHIFCIR